MVEYPYVRLRLECGCYEAEIVPGASNIYECRMHDALGPDAAEKALADARAAISLHGIVTVKNGGGVLRLSGVEAHASMARRRPLGVVSPVYKPGCIGEIY